jgi:hypothetical protein
VKNWEERCNGKEKLAEVSEEGQGQCRAVQPMMMMINTHCKFSAKRKTEWNNTIIWTDKNINKTNAIL